MPDTAADHGKALGDAVDEQDELIEVLKKVVVSQATRLDEHNNRLMDHETRLSALEEGCNQRIYGLTEIVNQLDERVFALENGNTPPPGEAPVNVAPPKILGEPRVGQTLTADVGRWKGKGPFRFEVEWWLAGASAEFLAAGPELVVPPKAEAQMITALVEAEDANGNTHTYQAPPVGPVLPAATVPPPGKSWPDTLVVPREPPRKTRSITVSPGGSLTEAISQADVDSEILLRAGTYRANVVPRDRQIIRVHPDNDGPVRWEPASNGPAIRGGASDVWVHGIEFAGYQTGKQEGVIQPDNWIGGGPAWRWKVTDCTVRDGSGRGITTCAGTGPAFDDMGVIARCKILRQGGNSGIGGSSGWNLIEDCHIADCNPSMRDMYEDGGAIKVTAGRDNKNIPTARGVIIRRNKIERHGANGIWCDWDGWGSLIEDNEVDDCQGAPIILECWAYSTVRRNRGKGNAKRQLEWVQSMKCAGVAGQNIFNCLFEDNDFKVNHGNERTHLTYQCRTGSGPTHTPQGGVGIGVFRSTDNLFRKNPGNGIDRTMYVDEPGCNHPDKNATGNTTCPNLFDSQATQCRRTPANGVYPEGSLYRLNPKYDRDIGFLDPTLPDLYGPEGRTNHYAYIPRTKAGSAALNNRWE